MASLTEWELAMLIDSWYFEWKAKFKDIHPLGFAKEDLKQRIAKQVALKERLDHNDRKEKKRQ